MGLESGGPLLQKLGMALPRCWGPGKGGSNGILGLDFEPRRLESSDINRNKETEIRRLESSDINTNKEI